MKREQSIVLFIWMAMVATSSRDGGRGILLPKLALVVLHLGRLLLQHLLLEQRAIDAIVRSPSLQCWRLEAMAANLRQHRRWLQLHPGLWLRHPRSVYVPIRGLYDVTTKEAF
jgi:hypothetical protein